MENKEKDKNFITKEYTPAEQFGNTMIFVVLFAFFIGWILFSQS